MAKVKKEKKEKATSDIKIKKKKMSAVQRNRLVMKIAAWIMVIVMAVGVMMTFLSYFITG